MAAMISWASTNAGGAAVGLAAAVVLVTAAAPAGAESAASGLLYERALMSAAGVRCGLFSPGVAAALEASRGQARGAALRAGDGAAAVQATEARATAKAAEVDCRDPGLQTAAARVRDAYADYAKLSVMRFPGARSAWRAERPDPRLPGERWALVEALPGTGGWMLFGVVDGRPVLLDARRGAAMASGVRLSLRDPGRLQQPFLSGPPPSDVSRVFLASTRGPAARALLPAGANSGLLYRFPVEALSALSALDPREVARLELIYPAAGRDRVLAVPLEIGDLAAARAFLAARS